jgi:hypothetical protein
MHSKSFIYRSVSSLKNYLHLLTNSMHSNIFIQIGVRSSSEGAFDGAVISPHSQAAMLNPLTP